jgi:hypothetical protein
MELEKEEYNERSEERGRRRDGETETASKSKTSVALPRQGMLIYEEVRQRQGAKHLGHDVKLSKLSNID